jgi:hypothetical protein
MSTASNTIEFIMKAKDEASAVIKQIGQSTEGLANNYKGSWHGA